MRGDYEIFFGEMPRGNVGESHKSGNSVTAPNQELSDVEQSESKLQGFCRFLTANQASTTMENTNFIAPTQHPRAPSMLVSTLRHYDITPFTYRILHFSPVQSLYPHRHSLIHLHTLPPSCSRRSKIKLHLPRKCFPCRHVDHLSYTIISTV